MLSKARGRFIPVSTRKIRLVARLIRGLPVTQAQAILKNMSKGVCKPVGKVLASAVANAGREGTVSSDRLVISSIFVDEGPMLKRYRSAPMGRALEIRKRMSHLTIELDLKGKKNGA